MSSDLPDASSRGRALVRALAILVWLAGLTGLLWGIPTSGTPGWDETGHAFAALRMGEALQAFDFGRFFHELHRPDFYTGPGRVGMAPAFLVSDSFAAPRVATGLAWFAAIALAALLARRLVDDERRDEASLWTVLFGATSWLGISYARAAFQEAWCALVTIVGVALWLGARERGTWPRAVLLGVWVGLAVVIKATYGLYLVAAIGGAQALDLLVRPTGVRAGRVALGTLLGAAIALGWWFVLPLPAGLEMGREHWSTFVTYLTKAAILSSHGPGFVWIVWILELGVSPILWGLAVAGIVWGILSWRDPLARIAAVLAVIGPAAFAAYPFRIDRFLIPTAFAGWILAAAVTVRLTGLAGPRGRLPAGLALVLLVFFTRGALQLPILKLGLGGDWPPEREAAALGAAATWKRPFERRPAPAVGPAGTQAALDAAAAHFDPAEPFGWIGGTGTEMPLWLLEWRLYQASGDRSLLARERPEVDHFWAEPQRPDGAPWTEEDFRAWAAGFPQIGVLDPPDPKNRPREFEVRYAAWMDAHPEFDRVAAVDLEIEIRKDVRQPFQVRVYRRR